jgi:ABC-type molybdate transport system substrate-binding protein
VLLILVLEARGGAQTPASPTGELTVFAAASLTEPFTELGARLEAASPGLKIRYNFGGSPTLRMQLEQGAQADVFASADAVQMELARKSGVVQGDSPIFVKNRLVVIVPRENPGQVTTLHMVPIPDAYNQIATYPIALTQRVQNRVAAERFLQFVLSAEGQAILKAHNFIPVTE